MDEERTARPRTAAVHTVPARRWARSGLAEGPRVRPRLDRWIVARPPGGPPAASGSSDGGPALVGHLPVPTGTSSPSAGPADPARAGARPPRVLVTLSAPDDDDARQAEAEWGPGARALGHLDAPYARALVTAGLTPWLWPAQAAPWRDAVVEVDGVVLTGGAFDIHPRHYGEAVAGRLDGVQEDRTATELALARWAVAQRVPVLGVCGGLQALGVALGARLVQHLPTTPRDHEQATDPATPDHPVVLDPAHAPAAPRATTHPPGRRPPPRPGPDGTPGDPAPPLVVNSTHHQALRGPAGLGEAVPGTSPPLRVWAVCPEDGVIEAAGLDARDHPHAHGIQWHPERLPHDPLDVYGRFAAAVRRHHEARRARQPLLGSAR